MYILNCLWFRATQMTQQLLPCVLYTLWSKIIMRPKSFWSRNIIHIVPPMISRDILPNIYFLNRRRKLKISWEMNSVWKKKDFIKVIHHCPNNMVMLVVHDEPQIKQHALMNIVQLKFMVSLVDDVNVL